MFNILSIIFKYIFIIIIYMFIFSIIRLIYLDIKKMDGSDLAGGAYLKLINRIDSIPYELEEDYSLEDGLTLGRSRDNNIVIKDPYISKKHLLIARKEDDFFLEDLKSANGTYLNGELTKGLVKLNNNDRIRIGDIEFVFISGK